MSEQTNIQLNGEILVHFPIDGGEPDNEKIDKSLGVGVDISSILGSMNYNFRGRYFSISGLKANGNPVQQTGNSLAFDIDITESVSLYLAQDKTDNDYGVKELATKYTYSPSIDLKAHYSVYNQPGEDKKSTYLGIALDYSLTDLVKMEFSRVKVSKKNLAAPTGPDNSKNSVKLQLRAC